MVPCFRPNTVIPLLTSHSGQKPPAQSRTYDISIILCVGKSNTYSRFVIWGAQFVYLADQRLDGELQATNSRTYPNTTSLMRSDFGFWNNNLALTTNSRWRWLRGFFAASHAWPTVNDLLTGTNTGAVSFLFSMTSRPIATQGVVVFLVRNLELNQQLSPDHQIKVKATPGVFMRIILI